MVTLTLSYDIDVIAKAGLIAADWQTKLTNNSVPYTSAIIFAVRKGHPKKITGWADLIKPGVGLIMPNPKTSGGTRRNFLAAMAYAKNAGVDPKSYVTALYKNLLVLGSGTRDSTTTFVKNGPGDVIGFVAGACGVAGFVPQLIQIVLEKDAESVSLKMFAVTTFGFVLWATYGVLHRSWPVITVNGVMLLLVPAILVLKIRYEGKRSSE